MRRLWSSLLGMLAVAAIILAVNVLAETRLPNTQLDLTQQHLYTLAAGTKTVLGGLKDPVTLRLYYSRRLGTEAPVYGAYADRVREMLRQYASLSNGKVRLQVLDPAPFTDTEDQALSAGLQGVPVDTGGEQVFFGLVGTNLLDDQRTIPFFQPERERFLEYDLTRLIYELSNPARPVVGIMSSLPLEGDPRAMMMMRGEGGKPWASITALRQTDTVKTVPMDAQVIDPDIQVLIVAQAQNLTPATLYAIDQFVLRGGRLLAMVDPYSESEAATPGPDGQPPLDVSSNLATLFDAWGISYDPAQVVGDLAGAWRVRASADQAAAPVDYVPWFNITPGGIAQDDPATADLRQITVASAGALAKKDGAAITFAPLLSSSATQSALVPVDKLRTPDPASLLAGFKPQGGARVIAARVSGHLKSAFTGPPPPPAGGKRPDNFPADLRESKGNANLVVVADSDILADRFWVRTQDFFGQTIETPFSDNGTFLANVVDTLTGGEALIGLRSRGESLHPFQVVDRMQRDAEAKFQQTEKTLQGHLDETEKRLTDLRQGTGATGGAQAAILTPEQRAAIDAAQAEIVQTRQKLRGVQLDLRRDIATLETEVRVADIAAVPALLTVLAIVIAIARRQRRARVRS